MRLPNRLKTMWTSAVCSPKIFGVEPVTDPTVMDPTGLSIGR